MHPRLYAKLYEEIDKFVENNCNTDEWQQEDFWTPENMTVMMTDGAASIFDAIVVSSQFTKEQIS